MCDGSLLRQGQVRGDPNGADVTGRPAGAGAGPALLRHRKLPERGGLRPPDRGRPRRRVDGGGRCARPTVSAVTRDSGKPVA